MSFTQALGMKPKTSKNVFRDLFFENSNLRLSTFIQEYKNFINYDFLNNRYENIDI